MATCEGSRLHGSSRIGDDMCSRSQRQIQNASSLGYTLGGYNSECQMDDAIGFATCQPAINFGGVGHMEVGGSNVDANSTLAISEMSRDKCRNSLWQRPFLTVPYLGRGRTDTLVESNLRKGEVDETSASSKSLHPLSEASYLRYTNAPLLPALK